MPTAAVSVLDHPGLWTSTWDVPRLAARFASGETLPQMVRERIDAYESSSVAGRWWERHADAAWTTWKRTVGAHPYTCGSGSGTGWRGSTES